MTGLRLLAAGYVAIVAAIGFLAGALFAGVLFPPALLAGVAGLATSAATVAATAGAAWAPAATRGAAIAALIGVGLDAVHYYRALDIPGNYYGWGLIGPCCACLAFLAVAPPGATPGGGTQ